MPPLSIKLLAVCGLLSGAVGWGLIWYPYRLLEQAGVSGALSSFLTYALALLFAVPYLVWQRREIRRPRAILVWLALTSGWTNLGYVLAVIEGEVMRVLLLFYLAPLWTVVFARVLLRERLDRYGYLIIALSLGGAFVMLWPAGGGLPLPQNRAEWFGLTAGILFALSNVLARKASDVGIVTKSLSIWMGVALLSLVPLVYQPQTLAVLGSLQISTWLLLAGVGLAIFTVTLTVQYGLSHTPANQAIVIFLSELVVAAVSSWLLVNELMTLREWLGGAMIVAASLFSGKLEESVQSRQSESGGTS